MTDVLAPTASGADPGAAASQTITGMAQVGFDTPQAVLAARAVERELVER